MWVSRFVLGIYTPLTVNANLLNILYSIYGTGRVTGLAGLEVFI